MKKSLRLFIIIVVVLFIVDRMGALVLGHFEKGIFEGQGVGKVNSFLKVKDSVDLLVFGSSRVAHHVNTDMLEFSNFNMGMDATKMSYAAALVSTLKKRNQIILVHLDHPIVYNELYKGEDAFRLTYKALQNGDIKKFFKKFFRKELLLSQISNSNAYNNKVFSIVKNTIMEGNGYNENKGYEPLFPSPEQKNIFNKQLEKQKNHFNVDIHKPLVYSPKFNQFVDEIIKVSENNSSKLIFFTSPSLNKVDSAVKKATLEFFEEKNTLYLDHIDFFETIEIDYWKDHTHLSDSGATKYSKYLNEILKKTVNGNPK